jgi:hypothetical protein
MPTYLRGWDGKITQGTGDTTVGSIESWDAEINQDIEELGPFLADAGTTYAARGALKLKFSGKGVIPSGGEASQTIIRNSLSSGTDLKFTMVSTGAGSIVVTTAIIDSVKIGHDSKKGTTFEVSGRNNGTFTF